MSEHRWNPKHTTSKCPTCGSLGFMTSPLGKNHCSYCDGTEGGHPPSFGDLTERIKALETKLAKAVEGLDGIMIGGNHLAVWLPDDHPTADVEPLAALEQIGAGVTFDVWCCWRSIMLARTTLAELKGDKT